MFGIENLSIDKKKYILKNFLNKLELKEELSFSNKELSSFIQDLFLDIQSDPTIIFADVDNNLFLEKGKQCYALLKFYEGKFPLTNLSILKNLEGLYYKDLPGKFYNYFNDFDLIVNVFYRNISEEFKLALLKRN